MTGQDRHAIQDLQNGTARKDNLKYCLDRQGATSRTDKLLSGQVGWYRQDIHATIWTLDRQNCTDRRDKLLKEHGRWYIQNGIYYYQDSEGGPARTDMLLW
jgi:hypothetical protein